MSKAQLIVVALGGNAISRPNEIGDVEQQFASSRLTARCLVDLIEQGHQLVITHGNGPQIGNFLLRNEAAADRIYPLPMEVAGAHVQGGMGYMIAQTLNNELELRGVRRTVTAVVTTILVDNDDPALSDPTKPIGRVFNAEKAERFAQDGVWTIKELEPGVFRRVVPSPIPQQIMELEHIQRAVEAGELIIACGGGGIPVVRDPHTGLRGVRAVIDKDLSSALLAAKLGVDMLLMLTNVDHVRINFGKPDERSIDTMTIAQAKGWLAEGQFGAGSMAPKILGAINFLESSEKTDAMAVIGPLDRATETVSGAVGTRVTR